MSILRFLVSAQALSLLITASCAGGDGQGSPEEPEGYEAEVVRGLPDEGRHPAVLALSIAGRGLCSGTLVAPNLVLTARHCLAEAPQTIRCSDSEPPTFGRSYPPSSITVYAGDSRAEFREIAQGYATVVDGADEVCGGDLGFLILDRPVEGISPMGFRWAGVEEGDFVRAVGFGRSLAAQGSGAKLYRNHILVLGVTEREFTVGEATCQGDSGGPVVDDATGRIVGVVSRGRNPCSGIRAHNVFTRTDAFAPLLRRAQHDARAMYTHPALPRRPVPDAGRRPNPSG